MAHGENAEKKSKSKEVWSHRGGPKVWMHTLNRISKSLTHRYERRQATNEIRKELKEVRPSCARLG